MSYIEEAGKYMAQVFAAEEDVTAKGTKFIRLDFETVDGDEISAELWVHTEGGLKQADKSLAVLGYDLAEHGYGFDDLLSDPCPIAGNWCELDVEMDDRYARVKWINSLNRRSRERMDDTEAAAFRKQLQANALKWRKGRERERFEPVVVPPARATQKVAAPQSTPTPGPGLTDDVPF